MTVTFLFTDLERSTTLLEALPTAYRDAMVRNHALLRGAVEGHSVAVFETVGDGVCAAFPRPTDADAAALEGLAALRAEPWGATGPLRARMGLHPGEVEHQVFKCSATRGPGARSTCQNAQRRRRRGGALRSDSCAHRCLVCNG